MGGGCHLRPASPRGGQGAPRSTRRRGPCPREANCRLFGAETSWQAAHDRERTTMPPMHPPHPDPPMGHRRPVGRGGADQLLRPHQPVGGGTAAEGRIRADRRRPGLAVQRHLLVLRAAADPDRHGAGPVRRHGHQPGQHLPLGAGVGRHRPGRRLRRRDGGPRRAGRGRGARLPGLVQGHRLLVPPAGAGAGHLALRRRGQVLQRDRRAAGGAGGGGPGLALGLRHHRRAELPLFRRLLRVLPRPEPRHPAGVGGNWPISVPAVRRRKARHRPARSRCSATCCAVPRCGG